jgi:hypothetical protein
VKKIYDVTFEIIDGEASCLSQSYIYTDDPNAAFTTLASIRGYDQLSFYIPTGFDENNHACQWQEVSPGYRVIKLFAVHEARLSIHNYPGLTIDLNQLLEAYKAYEATELWSKLGDIPVTGNDDRIEEEFIVNPFVSFPIGTPREDIWHWFEETYDLSVVEDLMRLSK